MLPSSRVTSTGPSSSTGPFCVGVTLRRPLLDAFGTDDHQLFLVVTGRDQTAAQQPLPPRCQYGSEGNGAAIGHLGRQARALQPFQGRGHPAEGRVNQEQHSAGPEQTGCSGTQPVDDQAAVVPGIPRSGRAPPGRSGIRRGHIGRIAEDQVEPSAARGSQQIAPDSFDPQPGERRVQACGEDRTVGAVDRGDSRAPPCCGESDEARPRPDVQDRRSGADPLPAERLTEQQLSSWGA